MEDLICFCYHNISMKIKLLVYWMSLSERELEQFRETLSRSELTSQANRSLFDMPSLLYGGGGSDPVPIYRQRIDQDGSLSQQHFRQQQPPLPEVHSWNALLSFAYNQVLKCSLVILKLTPEIKRYNFSYQLLRCWCRNYRFSSPVHTLDLSRFTAHLVLMNSDVW